MPTVDTAFSPREVLNRIYERLRQAYSKVLAAKPGDVKADESIMQDVEAIETYSQKLNFSMIKKMRDDANIDQNSLEKLRELEKLLDDIIRGKRTSIRQDHFVYRTARQLRGVVRGKARKSKATGTREYLKVQKEKKSLGKKEKEAKEKMGKKT